MARISARTIGHERIVTIDGDLQAGDLRRLERACGRALERPALELAVEIRRGGVTDEPARAYLERLVARGARVRRRQVPES